MKTIAGEIHYDTNEVKEMFGYKTRKSVHDLVSKGLKRNNDFRPALFSETAIKEFMRKRQS